MAFERSGERDAKCHCHDVEQGNTGRDDRSHHGCVLLGGKSRIENCGKDAIQCVYLQVLLATLNLADIVNRAVKAASKRRLRKAEALALLANYGSELAAEQRQRSGFHSISAT